MVTKKYSFRDVATRKIVTVRASTPTFAVRAARRKGVKNYEFLR